VPSNSPIGGHSFCRVEVLTGPPRRRRWSVAEKIAIVAESRVPGAQASEIALRYGLHRNQLYGWRAGVRIARCCQCDGRCRPASTRLRPGGGACWFLRGDVTR
jgi:hypothetical protein